MMACPDQLVGMVPQESAVRRGKTAFGVKTGRMEMMDILFQARRDRPDLLDHKDNRVRLGLDFLA